MAAIEIIMRSWNTRADDMGSFWGGIADKIIKHLNAKPAATKAVEKKYEATPLTKE